MDDLTEVRRLRIRTRLLMGLATLLLLMAAVSSCLLWQLSLMQRNHTILHCVGTLERHLLECRRQEKNFLLRHEPANIDLFQANLDSLIVGTGALRGNLRDEVISAKLGLLSGKEQSYGSVFETLATAVPGSPEAGESAQWMLEVVALARECHALMNEIRSVALARLDAAGRVTRGVNIATLALGLLLFLIIMGWLTRSIAAPLEYLRGQAERISVGDIQDMDVELSGLEMGRFRTRETYDLARAFQRMITSVRLTVSSERGMMDNYHMTIVVLANQLFGPAGRAIVERARGKAGFESFADVDPSNVERFLAALQREARGVIPAESTLLLIDAIRKLNG